MKHGKPQAKDIRDADALAAILEGLGVDRKRDITYPVWKARREELLPFEELVRRLRGEVAGPKL